MTSMKKIVSAPRLHQSTIFSSSVGFMSETQSRTQLVDEPVKLSEYLKNRQEMNKSFIMERIKSNPLLVTHEDPVAKQTREKKEFILRNTDKLVSFLTKRKTNIDSKTLSELSKDQQLIQKLLEVFSDADKVQREVNPFAMSKRQFKNAPLEESNEAKTNIGSFKLQMPKLNTSSYLNKADSVGSTVRSQIAEKTQRIPPMMSREQTKAGQNYNRLPSELLNFSRKQTKNSQKN